MPFPPPQAVGRGAVGRARRGVGRIRRARPRASVEAVGELVRGSAGDVLWLPRPHRVGTAGPRCPACVAPRRTSPGTTSAVAPACRGTGCRGRGLLATARALPQPANPEPVRLAPLAARTPKPVGPAYTAQDLPAAPLGREGAIELVQGRRCLHRHSSLAESQGGSCSYRVTTAVTRGANGIARGHSNRDSSVRSAFCPSYRCGRCSKGRAPPMWLVQRSGSGKPTARPGAPKGPGAPVRSIYKEGGHLHEAQSRRGGRYPVPPPELLLRRNRPTR